MSENLYFNIEQQRMMWFGFWVKERAPDLWDAFNQEVPE